MDMCNFDDFLMPTKFKVGDIVSATEESIKNGWPNQRNPEIGKRYTVTKVTMYNCYTDVYVEGEVRPFNSVKLVIIPKGE